MKDLHFAGNVLEINLSYSRTRKWNHCSAAVCKNHCRVVIDHWLSNMWSSYLVLSHPKAQVWGGTVQRSSTLIFVLYCNFYCTRSIVSALVHFTPWNYKPVIVLALIPRTIFTFEHIRPLFPQVSPSVQDFPTDWILTCRFLFFFVTSLKQTSLSWAGFLFFGSKVVFCWPSFCRDLTVLYFYSQQQVSVFRWTCLG